MPLVPGALTEADATPAGVTLTPLLAAVVAAPTGTTEFESGDGLLVPTPFVAVTENSYWSPATSPAIVADVVVPAT